MLPQQLNRKHILQAIQDIDSGMKTRWRAPKKYLLIYKNKAYAPKEVLGRANCIAKMIGEWELGDFSGGSPTNDILASIGFKIVLKDSKRGKKAA
jgi:hypothetical protein